MYKILIWEEEKGKEGGTEGKEKGEEREDWGKYDKSLLYDWA